MADIQGTCDPGYEAVGDAFEKNFDLGDLGATCAVVVDGETVVDLWGGTADIDGDRTWERDTIVNVWSTTKTMTALCVLMLHDRGVLDVDQPVADVWPEFAENGKEAVLVRHILSHSAGLPGFDDADRRGSVVRLGLRVRTPGVPGSLVGARHEVRVPLCDPGVAARRGASSSRWTHHGNVLR